MPAAPRQPDARNVLRRHPWRVALVLFAAGIVALALLWDWNWFKGPVERIVAARTGRSFDIGGDLDVHPGRITSISLGRVRFGNASWSKSPVMASADRVAFDVALWPLLKRQVRIPQLRLAHPRLLLERGPDGTGNWVFGQPGGSNAQVRRLWIDDGRLQYIDNKQATAIDVAVASAAATPGTAPPIDARGRGRWKGAAFKVRGRAESPLALRDADKPYHIDAVIDAGATRAHARGTLLDPLRLSGFDLQFALSGRNLGDLYPLLHIATPPSPPYHFDGRLTRELQGTRTTWHYDRFAGKVGDSDLAGSAAITVGGVRPFLRGVLVSRMLDFDDLAVFIGKAPHAGGGETTNPELAAQAAREQASPRVLPDTPYNLDKLRAMDADVRWKAQRINAPKLPLDDMDVHLRLDGGLLRLDPLDFGVASGHIRSTVRMDARDSPIHTHADASVRGLDLARLLPRIQTARDAIGRVGGSVSLSGSGNSIAKMLGSADGGIAVGMGHGQISNLVMELAGLDIAESLKFLLTGDKLIPIRCAFGDFSVQGGVMHANALAFDTTDTLIVGEGNISLRDETLDLTLRPRPKDRSLLALRSPLVVSGTFKAPRFHPDYRRLGLRGALALSLGSIAPPAALLATLELGPGKDAQCGGKYAK
ncbi:MAG: AsmA family protein [Lysobacter sp.]|nr:AsmA family protein [Lysobacter sp.]